MPPHFDSPLVEGFAPKPQASVACRTDALPAEILAAIGATSCDDLTVMQLDKRVTELVSAQVFKARGGAHGSAGDVGSLSIEATRGGACAAGCDSDSEDEIEDGANCCATNADAFLHTSVSLGLGVHAFPHNGETLWLAHYAVGAPVGTNCGPAVYSQTALVARGRGRGADLQRLCDELIAYAERDQAHTFRMYQWHVKYEYWQHRGVRTARPVDSVVLPKEVQQRTVTDMQDFLTAKTRRFYMANGIPYKRAYLFWGVPGTGKTSLIQALAGKFKRAVCYMQPTDPKFTDDMLRDAVASAPANSVIVMEDIDALFTKDRENRGKSAVTFSGLLNALDGVGMKDGLIFVLTTNFRENLDAALIRNGRVDVHVEFKHIAPEEQKVMFRKFYKNDEALVGEFVATLERELGERAKELTPAALQHFFIQNCKVSGAEALKRVKDIGKEFDQREEEKKKDDDKDKKDKDKKDKDEDEKNDSTSKAVTTCQEWKLSVSPTVAMMVVAAVCLPVLIRQQNRRA